ncbi:MAG TPA: M20/M25/M40 family metallo-hydrolase [Gemmatimonadaceae bacterium]|nr:M20/M25/M40 family metallo-hydrolase [Gemmatimonadaceae bacterium]
MPRASLAVRRAARRLAPALLCLAVAAAGAAAQTDVPDSAAMARIRDEGFHHSQVMDIESWLSDVYGPRLTASPYAREAADWVLKQLTTWGASNPHLEWWDFGGRGWVSDRFSAQVVAPHPFPLIAYPGAWSDGTHGPETGAVAIVHVDSMADFAKYHGTLAGKWVMTSAPADLELNFTPDAHRFTDEELAAMAAAPEPTGSGARPGPTAAIIRQRMVAAEFSRFLVKEHALGELRLGRGSDGTLIVMAAGARDLHAPPALPAILVSAENYGRIYRIVEKGIPVKVEVNARNRFIDGDGKSFNIVAEIPGTDLKDQVVMLGAHFDSWPSGTGAADNGAGAAVMLEAFRILKTLKMPMRRTVRLALWTGEEQGLLGSRAYVREHFGYADSTGHHFTPENAKIAAYFNVDNGSGAIRGVYLQGNAAVKPIFAQWLAPFRDLGASTLTLSNTGGTDHLSFDAVTIPGFQFIQDPLDYHTRTHHTNEDVYERVQPHDMMQNAVIVASFVYDAANRAEPLPRMEVKR